MPRARKIKPTPSLEQTEDRISFTLSISLNERVRVEHHAKREDRSLSALIRRALTLYLDAADDEERKKGKTIGKEDAKSVEGPETRWEDNPFEKKS
jgi:Arc/MetJ-type ribon-helix-helix transcriptional regulator